MIAIIDLLSSSLSLVIARRPCRSLTRPPGCSHPLMTGAWKALQTELCPGGNVLAAGHGFIQCWLKLRPTGQEASVPPSTGNQRLPQEWLHSAFPESLRIGGGPGGREGQVLTPTHPPCSLLTDGRAGADYTRCRLSGQWRIAPAVGPPRCAVRHLGGLVGRGKQGGARKAMGTKTSSVQPREGKLPGNYPPKPEIPKQGNEGSTRRAVHHPTDPKRNQPKSPSWLCSKWGSKPSAGTFPGEGRGGPAASCS